MTATEIKELHQVKQFIRDEEQKPEAIRSPRYKTAVKRLEELQKAERASDEILQAAARKREDEARAAREEMLDLLLRLREIGEEFRRLGENSALGIAKARCLEIHSGIKALTRGQI